jgi:predicted RNA-binding protein YlqC (UPF0109 family)
VSEARTAVAPTATAVVEYLVRSLVDDPDAVAVHASERRRRGGGVLLEVRTGPGDMGRVIGKAGKTAQAIRAVVRAAATKDGVEVDVDFVD